MRHNVFMHPPVTAIILAAGLGTRMKSKTAKVLHRAGGRTLVEHVAEAALAIARPEDTWVVVGHQEAGVRAALEGRGLRFARQAEQKGTAHAVMACRDAARAGGLTVVLYGDCPLLTGETLARLIAGHAASRAAATVLSAILDNPTGYGRIVRDVSGSVGRIVEQKDASPEELAIREINTGIYCLESALLWEYIGRIRPDNPAGEYYLTDIVELLRAAGHRVDAVVHSDWREVLGINTRVELAEADRVLRERTNRRLMLDGVTIEKPETVTIDAQVRIGRDSVIGPFTQILGNTEIGEECRIGAGSIIEDSRLGDRVHIAPFTVMAGSDLADSAQAGPFARLRPGARLEADARVGNFVELKKTRLGAGSKAMHLAYLGDAVIGAKANIGAGTITCNYDGVKKHPTTIGDGVFVGSNSSLVAPVEIGAGSYVAAGSVITHGVPADALAIGRARQENKPEWARRRRERQKAKPEPPGSAIL